MRLILAIGLLLRSALADAADREASFLFMPGYWYGYHWEETPDSVGKASERLMIVTAAWRGPYGLSLGGTWLKNTVHAQDSRIQLSAQGLSLGFVGAGHVSAFYTFLYKPRLDYDFPSLAAQTSYYGGSGSLLDLGLHFGSSWLRVGPRVLFMDVNYQESSASAGSETETAALDGRPWRDRWLEPYLGIWLLF